MVLPSTNGTFHLSVLAGRGNQIANEVDFFHRVFAEKASPSCILFSRIVLIKSEDGNGLAGQF